MPSWLNVLRSLVATTGLLWSAWPACSGDAAAFRQSLDHLADSTGAADPARLLGIGQIYCKMKEYVGDAPLTTDTALAVLHRQHPETRAKSRRERDVQAEAMRLAALLLCPEAPVAPASPQ